MMRKITTILILTLLFVGGAFAQDYNYGTAVTTQENILQRIGYVNSNEILEAMPESVKASAEVKDLNKKYKDELVVMQNDYNKKYSDFISSQNRLADNIRLRRMQELYELEKHISEFMLVAQKDIEEQEQKKIVPLRKKVKEAIKEVGIENRFICIYDLANPTIVFVTPDGVNITTLVKTRLGIK